MAYVIRYTYPGTTNGRAVGDVYVTGPHFGNSIFSHTYDPHEAARFDTREQADRLLSQHRWNKGRVVELETAENLKTAAMQEP